MRKREILKHYKNSLEKWEEIYTHFIGENRRGDYVKDFWVECGFCEVHVRNWFGDNCEGCPLQRKNTKGIPYCQDSKSNPSVGLNILKYCDKRRWKEAEKLCKQFIAKIKREIKKVENK